MQTSDMILLLKIAIAILVIVVFGLIFAYIYVDKKKKNPKKTDDLIQDTIGGEQNKDKNQNYGRFQGELTQESIYEFMEFDEVIDNMIVRKNRTQFVMVLQCNGVNYDLMSEPE